MSLSRSSWSEFKLGFSTKNIIKMKNLEGLTKKVLDLDQGVYF